MSSLKKTKRNHIIMEAVKKKEIVHFMLENPSKTQTEVAKHFSGRFRLPVSRRTVGDIFRDKEKWLNCKNKNHLIESSVKFPKLEEALTIWIHNARENNFVLTDDIIVQKAKTLGGMLNIPEKEFKYSSGWLYRFKKRNGMLRKVILSEDTPGVDDFVDFVSVKNEFHHTDEEELIQPPPKITLEQAKNSILCLQDFFYQQPMTTESDIRNLSNLWGKIQLIENRIRNENE